MRVRYAILPLLGIATILFSAGHSPAQEKFKLKPGAKGKLCLNCHVTFQDILKSPSVHTPARTGECSGCHNPHTSSHGKLLSADPAKMCAGCHAVVPDKAASVHKVVAEGNCISCHDTHAAPYKFNLKKNGNELCFGCHKDIGEAVAKAKFKHHPVEQGCLSCHSPHASSKSGFLLKEEVPSLCVSCHKTGNPVFVKRHMNYPVAKSLCTSCHDPHGSSTSGILYDGVHRPVANKMCNQCHEEPSPDGPVRTKREGYDLCKGCHNTMINETFGKSRIHWPLASKNACLSCHNPHASPQPSLLKGQRKKLCATCHQDTFDRQERAPDQHAPVQEGKCNACHEPHSSNNTFLLKQPVIPQCGTCHDWKRHSSHPVGEKMRDPRNKNLYVQCLSCHSAHGTPYKKMLLLPSASEMCTQCHTNFGR